MKRQPVLAVLAGAGLGGVAIAVTVVAAQDAAGGAVAAATHGVVSNVVRAMVRGQSAIGTCSAMKPEWLMCEDFEAGGLGWSKWFAASPFVECLGCNGTTNNPARIRLAEGAATAHSGDWALEMPAEASAGYQGASLTYRSCAGAKREGCRLNGYEALYFRTWVKLADEHLMVHHFLEIAGSRPNAYWDSDGNAGCRPNGTRWAGTTLDFARDDLLYFYTYYPEMKCDRGNYCSGDYVQQLCTQCAAKNMPCLSQPECCWGNAFRPAKPAPIPKGRWVCLEMSLHLNTPGKADGRMAFWVDEVQALDQGGMHWRDVADLQLNKAWLQHYIAAGDAQQSNRVWFDDVVVSTARIGCGAPPAAPSATAGATVEATATAEVGPTSTATAGPSASATPTRRPSPAASTSPVAPTGMPPAPTPERWRVRLPALRRGG